jgi:hypothetical protein
LLDSQSKARPISTLLAKHGIKLELDYQIKIPPKPVDVGSSLRDER